MEHPYDYNSNGFDSQYQADAQKGQQPNGAVPTNPYQQSTYAQPEQSAQQNPYAEQNTQQSPYAQPEQNVQQNTYAKSEQNAQWSSYAQPAQNAYAQPEQGAQPNAHTQPEQNAYTPRYGAYTNQQSYQQNTNIPPVPPVHPKKKAKKNGHSAARSVALVLTCALIGGAMGFGGSLLSNQVFSNKNSYTGGGRTTIMEGSRETTAIDVSHVNTEKELTAAEVYAANVNSTVGIKTSITTNYWGYQTTSAAAGSGFVLTADGYVLTNYHVIESSDTITVSTYDGKSYDATLVGYDASNDIAVLKINAEDLTPVVLGDSDQLHVGDGVIAIGNPLGELTFSLTSGAVSALNREVTLSGNVTMDLIQTDCAINSGNSGGALFNMYGEVIGITNAKYSGSGMSGTASIDNIGFAIPINHVKSIVESIIEKGYISKPYIGVKVDNVSDETQRYGLPAGAAIYSVVKDSPAAKAGLRANDIITAVNGEEISDRNDLSDKISKCEVGDVLKLTVYRQNESIEISVTVGEQVQSAKQEEDTQGQQSIFPWGFGG